MKKLLALVLALVMTLSLCTVTNAAYPDAADVDYKEAVDVMSALGVFQGDEKGNFNPDAVLTRETAAKILTYMILGKTAADTLVTIAAPYADVEANRWSAGSIAYCTNEGILAGKGDGTFGPTEPLTGLAFAKMCLVALGYDAEAEGLVGNTWSINVAKLALTVGLTEDLDDVALSGALTREQAAQMAFNTELATMVEYENNSTITAGDITIKTNSKADKIERAATAADYHGTDEATAKDGYLQFCEKYASKLVLSEGEADAFGRPATKWTYKSKDVGTYAEEAVATFTADTKADAVATALKGYKFTDGATTPAYAKVENTTKAAFTAEVNVFKNSKTATATTFAIASTETVAAAIADETANGTLIEVYANSDKVITDIVVVEYTNQTVEKVTTDKKTGDVTYKLSASGNKVDYADPDKTDTISFTTAPAKDDVVTVAVIGSKAYVYATEKVEGPITYAKGAEKLTIAGTSYTANAAYTGNFGLTDKDATVWVDQYGFVADYEGPSTSGDKSVIITDVYSTLDGGKIVTMVKGVKSSGEEVEFKLGNTAPNIGDVCTYAENSTDSAKTDFTAVNNSAVFDGALANDLVAYVGDAAQTASAKKVIVKTTGSVYGFYTGDVKVIFVDAKGKATVSDGMQKIAAGCDQYAVLKKNADDATWYIDTLYVVGAPVASSSTSDDIVFVKAAASPAEIGKMVDGKQKTYYEYTAYINGEKVDGFYAVDASLAANKFFTVDVENASGAYILAGNEYATATGKLAVTGEVSITTKVNGVNILTLSDDYDMSGAEVIDLTSDQNDLASISDLNDAIDAGTVKAYFIFNEENMTVNYVYVTAYTAF